MFPGRRLAAPLHAAHSGDDSGSSLLNPKNSLCHALHDGNAEAACFACGNAKIRRDENKACFLPGRLEIIRFLFRKGCSWLSFTTHPFRMVSPNHEMSVPACRRDISFAAVAPENPRHAEFFPGHAAARRVFSGGLRFAAIKNRKSSQCGFLGCPGFFAMEADSRSS